MLTKSRSFLVSLAAGLLLAVGSLGCDVEDPTDSEYADAESDEVMQVEGDLTVNPVESLRGLRAREVDLTTLHQKGALTGASRASSGKVAAPVSGTNSVPFVPDIETTGDEASFGFGVGDLHEDHVGNPTTLGANKSEPEPDPWNPGEPEPDPWMPDPDDRDDRY